MTKERRTTWELRDIWFRKNGATILQRVNLGIQAGEVHAVVGDHGSGKSSLGLILSGIERPTSGSLLVDGQAVSCLSQKQARRFGIEMVFQDQMLIDHFSVAENLYLPEKIMNHFLYFKRSLYDEAEAAIRCCGFEINPRALFRELSPSKKGIVCIIRCLIREPRLLILDETLENLVGDDHEKVLAALRSRTRQGMALVCISHRIDDIYDIADRVSIFKKGELFLTDRTDNIDRLNLIKMCYIQVSRNQNSQDLNKVFYETMKYNEAVLQRLPLSVLVIDSEERIKMVNETGRAYFDIGDRPIGSYTLRDLVKDNDSSLALIREAMKSPAERSVYNLSMKLKHAATVNVKTYPIHDGAFLIGHMIIIEDITEQEKLRQQLILTEKQASVGLLAAGVAHEINNPLEIIMNNLNYLNFDPSPAIIRETIQGIGEEIRDIKTIVGNLITFSDHKIVMNEEFDINELISSLLHLTKFIARSSNIAIRFGCDQPINLRGNKTEMKQVILNLLKNSFEAMPEGGRIDISTEKINQALLLRISDTGPGIQDKNPDNIFLPFYSDKQSRGTNLGLGLSVTYGIIRKYKGTISVENLDTGCRFSITLPCA